MGRPVHRLRHLQALLQNEQEFLYQPKGSWISPAFAIATIAIILILILSRFSLVVLLLLGITSPFLYVLLASMLARHREDLALGWSKEGAQALQELRTYDRDSTLEERTDAEIGDALNACCAIYRDIHTLLKSQEWLHAEGVRLEARKAAESILGKLCDDAVVISLAGVRTKGQRRDTFQRRMIDPTIKNPILEDLRAIQDRLVDLRDELKAASQMNAEENSFQTTLERIAEIRRAEEELRDSITTTG